MKRNEWGFHAAGTNCTTYKANLPTDRISQHLEAVSFHLSLPTCQNNQGLPCPKFFDNFLFPLGPGACRYPVISSWTVLLIAPGYLFLCCAKKKNQYADLGMVSGPRNVFARSDDGNKGNIQERNDPNARQAGCISM